MSSFGSRPFRPPMVTSSMPGRASTMSSHGNTQQQEKGDGKQMQNFPTKTKSEEEYVGITFKHSGYVRL